jgi:hypothetical protein
MKLVLMRNKPCHDHPESLIYEFATHTRLKSVGGSEFGQGGGSVR